MSIVRCVWLDRTPPMQHWRDGESWMWATPSVSVRHGHALPSQAGSGDQLWPARCGMAARFFFVPSRADVRQGWGNFIFMYDYYYIIMYYYYYTINSCCIILILLIHYIIVGLAVQQFLFQFIFIFFHFLGVEGIIALQHTVHSMSWWACPWCSM